MTHHIITMMPAVRITAASMAEDITEVVLMEVASMEEQAAGTIEFGGTQGLVDLAALVWASRIPPLIRLRWAADWSQRDPGHQTECPARWYWLI
jgi:hypothetical protein